MPSPESSRRLTLAPLRSHLAGKVIGIGSLPHKNFAEAFAFLEEQKLEIIFLPQLPQAPSHGNMLEELSKHSDGVFAHRELSHFLKKNRLAQAVVVEQDETKESTGQDFWLKWQIVGPLTYQKFSGHSLLESGDLILGEVKARLQALLRTLEGTTYKQILFLDEPSLASERLNSEDYRAFVTKLKEMFSSANIELVLGLHCCGRFAAKDSDVLEQMGFQILSFDLHLFSSTNELTHFLQNLNTSLCWCLGVVPTGHPEAGRSGVIALVEKLKMELSQISRQYPDLQGSLSQSLVSASCGLSGWSEADVAFLFAQQKEFAQWLRQMNFVNSLDGLPTSSKK